MQSKKTLKKCIHCGNVFTIKDPRGSHKELCDKCAKIRKEFSKSYKNKMPWHPITKSQSPTLRACSKCFKPITTRQWSQRQIENKILLCTNCLKKECRNRSPLEREFKKMCVCVQAIAEDTLL